MPATWYPAVIDEYRADIIRAQQEIADLESGVIKWYRQEGGGWPLVEGSVALIGSNKQKIKLLEAIIARFEEDQGSG